MLATNTRLDDQSLSVEAELPLEKLPCSRVTIPDNPSYNSSHGCIRRSSSVSVRHEELCLGTSDCSMSIPSDGGRSPEVATPRSGPYSSENSSIAFSLSPRSRTSSLVPTQFHPAERKERAPSPTKSTQRTPLPTRKDFNATRDASEPQQEMNINTRTTHQKLSPSQVDSSENPRGRSADLSGDMNLEQKNGTFPPVSSDSITVDLSRRKTLSVGGNYSRHRSPSVASSCDIASVEVSTRTRTRTRSPSSPISANDAETPPRKRLALDDNRGAERVLDETTQEAHVTVSSNFAVLTSDSMDPSRDAGNKIAKRRGRKPSSINIDEKNHSMEYTSPRDGYNQPKLTNNPKRDNNAGGPHQLSPLDHTPRLMSDSSQPFARPPPLHQLANLPPPQLHRTLPPRPSITPPPGSSPENSQKYRPPAVVFTIDNRAESRMLTADVQSFIEQFTKNARVISTPIPPSTTPCAHPIGVIMWQSLPDFYKWYTETTGSAAIGSLRFELIDVQWQAEKVFVVPEGNLNYFRTLKQYVWDLFWVASHLNNGPSLFQVSISPFPSRKEALPAATSSWKSVNEAIPRPRISGAANLENIMVVPEPRTSLVPISSPRPAFRSPMPSTLTSKTSNIEHILNAKEAKDVKSRAARGPMPAASVQLATKSSNDAGGRSNRPPRPSEYIHGPPGPPVNTSRTSWDKVMLRDQAHAFVRHPPPDFDSMAILTVLKLIGRNDIELLNEESTVHDKLPYKTGAEVCGTIVDRRSGKGLVTVTGKGFITQNITTGPEETGERYHQLNIQAKQTCMLHGDAVVLYYKRRSIGSPQPLQKASSQQSTQSAVSNTSAGSKDSPPIEIIVRLQIDGTGKFSAPFDKSVLRPKVNTTEFFSWFSTQTRRAGPHGPPCLKFTFKDAMPLPKATEVSRGNEDHFDYMRKDIKAQCEKAKAYMPELKEFVVLVTVPDWSSPKREEEEDW